MKNWQVNMDYYVKEIDKTTPSIHNWIRRRFFREVFLCVYASPIFKVRTAPAAARTIPKITEPIVRLDNWLNNPVL